MKDYFLQSQLMKLNQIIYLHSKLTTLPYSGHDTNSVIRRKGYPFLRVITLHTNKTKGIYIDRCPRSYSIICKLFSAAVRIELQITFKLIYFKAL